MFPLINNWSICEAFSSLKTNLKTRGRLLLFRQRLVGPPQQGAPRTVCVSVCFRGWRQLRTGVGGRRWSRERPAAQNTAEEESDGKRDRKGEKVSDGSLQNHSFLCDEASLWIYREVISQISNTSSQTCYLDGKNKANCKILLKLSVVNRHFLLLLWPTVLHSCCPMRDCFWHFRCAHIHFFKVRIKCFTFGIRSTTTRSDRSWTFQTFIY